MTTPRRQMHLAVFWLGTGNHAAGWRLEGATDSNSDWEIVEAAARTAERGLLDMFFISDSLVPDPNDHPSFMTRFEPTTLVASLARATTHIGLGATVSTSFAEPYTVARTFQTLQHLSRGRVAWNVVTTTSDKAALNFSRERLLEHDKRYDVANEFVDVVVKLWNSWEDGALVRDRAKGLFVDPTRVGPIDHKGQFFAVRGPLNVAKPAWGNPLIIQAGGSVPGQELSARTADLVFTVVSGDPDAAKASYDGLKARLPKHGRRAEDLAILPGVMPIVGRTREEAKATLDRLQGWLSAGNALTLVSNRIGHDLTGYPLDGPIPELPATTNRGQTFSRTLLDKARRERMTLRDLYNLTAAARGHWVICGTAGEIADTLEDWFRAERADGFMLLPPYFPGGFEDFIDLVIPELQRRGVYRTAYSGSTLRAHLGKT